MGGQHIEQQARYEQTGMTTVERNELIGKLYQKGYSQRQIARHLGMTQPAVHYALLKLAGKERNRAKYDVCDWCGENAPRGSLVEGMCKDCRDGG